MTKVSFLAGIPGAGKSTMIMEMRREYQGRGESFDSRFQVVTFSNLMKRRLKERERKLAADDLRAELSLTDTYELQKEVYDEIFSLQGNVIVDSHSRIFLPGLDRSAEGYLKLKGELELFPTDDPKGLFSNGFPLSFHERYELVGVALIQPEDTEALKRQRTQDHSRKRDDFPSPSLQQREEYNYAQRMADRAHCPFMPFTNRHGDAKSAALELADFLEDVYALDCRPC